MNDMEEMMLLEFRAACREAQQRIQDCAIDASRALQAPHLLHKAKLSKDGNQWCWLYGDNLQEGIAGFGDTPYKASQEFDRAWGFFA